MGKTAKRRRDLASLLQGFVQDFYRMQGCNAGAVQYLMAAAGAGSSNDYLGRLFPDSGK